MDQDHPWIGPSAGPHRRQTVLPWRRGLNSPYGLATILVPRCGELLTCTLHRQPRKPRPRWRPYWERLTAPTPRRHPADFTWGPR